jgi:hypothetical protein
MPLARDETVSECGRRYKNHMSSPLSRTNGMHNVRPEHSGPCQNIHGCCICCIHLHHSIHSLIQTLHLLILPIYRYTAIWFPCRLPETETILTAPPCTQNRRARQREPENQQSLTSFLHKNCIVTPTKYGQKTSRYVSRTMKHSDRPSSRF